jgi:hypothetical protein
MALASPKSDGYSWQAGVINTGAEKYSGRAGDTNGGEKTGPGSFMQPSAEGEKQARRTFVRGRPVIYDSK